MDDTAARHAAAIARLPQGACILNVGRGAVMDEDAFVEGVRSGHLAGGYLDVFATEPLPEDSPLWDLPNVILSPHCAGGGAASSSSSTK